MCKYPRFGIFALEYSLTIISNRPVAVRAGASWCSSASGLFHTIAVSQEKLLFSKRASPHDGYAAGETKRRQFSLKKQCARYLLHALVALVKFLTGTQTHDVVSHYSVLNVCSPYLMHLFFLLSPSPVQATEISMLWQPVLNVPNFPFLVFFLLCFCCHGKGQETIADRWKLKGWRNVTS